MAKSMVTAQARSSKRVRPRERSFASFPGSWLGWTCRILFAFFSMHTFISQLASTQLIQGARLIRGQAAVNSAVEPTVEPDPREGSRGLTSVVNSSSQTAPLLERSGLKQAGVAVANATDEPVAVANATIEPVTVVHSTEELAQPGERSGLKPITVANATIEPVQAQERPGFIVLGMHRSGTSMLAGVFVNGLGYNVGGPLFAASSENEKGYFERIDVADQNDEFMNLQQGDWGHNLDAFDTATALEDKTSGEASFESGKSALEFFNNEANSPWLQKDPRMCITLKTWLPLFSREPAVLWTYRHPLEVAYSLMTRESRMTLAYSIRLWIAYNIHGLQNSHGLCRVFTSNDAILADPLVEIQRISRELTTKCGVPAPPIALSQQEVTDFLDLSLQHSKKKVVNDQRVLERHGDCQVHDFVTQTATTDAIYEVEKKLYLIAMQLYCDMGSEEAYKEGYDWSDLEQRLEQL